MVSLRHRVFEWRARHDPIPDPVDLDDLRRQLAEQQALTPLGPPASLTEAFDVVTLAGFGADAECPAYAVTTRGADPEQTVFYLHGGGYVGHADPQHWRYAGRLAERAHARVIVAQYPIAPGHTWRDAHPAVLEVYRKLAADTDHQISLLGDSAGGGFVLSLAQRLVADGDPLPAALVVFCPWADLANDTGEPADDPWMSKRFLDLCAELWAGGDPLRVPELSPLFGRFAGLPRLLVVCGTKDLGLPQSRAVVAAARAAGVPTTYLEPRGLLHDYPVLNLPEAHTALDQVTDFLAGRPVAQGSTS